MSDENLGRGAALHSLISLEDFKTIFGFDDRGDVLNRYCLITSTYTIEQYCKRRLLLKRHFEWIEFHGDLILPLGEYPVREILAVYALGGFTDTGELLEPELYRVIPDFEEAEGLPEDMPYSLSLSPALNRGRGLAGVKAVYRAGYGYGEAPSDLASACLELAAGPKPFVVNMENFLAPRRAALLGVEHEPVPGTAHWNDQERPGRREGRGAFGGLHAGERAAITGTV
jgi:hypothetical protein